jgi:hypothetical protein
MANCSGIFQGADLDCQNPLSVGVIQRLFLANRADVLSLTYDLTPGRENVITGIVMKTGKAFFEFAGVNESIKGQNELVRRAVSNGYKHQIDFSIFEVGNTSLANMQAMAYQPQIGILYGPDDTSLENGAFQVYGVDNGLDLLTNVRINNDVETGGAHVLQLATPDTGGDEKIIPPVLWNTDYATTLNIVEALLIPAT